MKKQEITVKLAFIFGLCPRTHRGFAAEGGCKNCNSEYWGCKTKITKEGLSWKM